MEERIRFSGPFDSNYHNTDMCYNIDGVYILCRQYNDPKFKDDNGNFCITNNLLLFVKEAENQYREYILDSGANGNTQAEIIDTLKKFDNNQVSSLKDKQNGIISCPTNDMSENNV